MARLRIEVDSATDPDPVLDSRYRVISKQRDLSRGDLILEVECDDIAAADLQGRPGFLIVSADDSGTPTV